MNKLEEGRSVFPENRYQKTLSLMSKVVNEGEL